MFDWGGELRKERLTLGLTQVSLGEALEESHSTISFVESGERRPSLKLRVKLARTFRGRFAEALEAEDGIRVPLVVRK